MLRLEANLDEINKIKAMAGGNPIVMLSIKARISIEDQGLKLLRLVGQPLVITLEGRQLDMFESVGDADQEEEPDRPGLSGDRLVPVGLRHGGR